MKSILIFFVIIFAISCTPVTKIYLVRHAEKNGNTANADLKDPEGFARAGALRDTFSRRKLTAVYSTNVPRTIHTAQPTADAKGTPVIIYNNGDSLIDKLVQQKNKRFLVAGHSNTIPQMIRRIGLDPGFTGFIPDNDFDNLFVVTIKWRKDSAYRSLEKRTYGAPSP